MVSWLILCASTAGGHDINPWLGAKIPYTAQYGKRNKIFFFLSKGQKCSNKGASTSLTWESVGTLVTSGWRRGF